MNRKAQLLTIREEILVRAISSGDNLIIKEAGLWDELGFDSAASSIKNLVQGSVVQEDTPTGYLEAFGDVLLSGALFKAHPLLGIAYSVANALGVDIKGIVSDILNKVKNAVMGGRTLSTSDFDTFSKSAFTKPNLVKIAQRSDIPFLPQKGESNLTRRIFGGLTQRRGKLLAKGIIIWALKTALLGAGLMTATGVATKAVKDLVSSDEEESKISDSEEIFTGSGKPAPDASDTGITPTEEPSISKVRSPTFQKSKLRPSGKGEKKFKNDEANMWMVPLLYGDITDTVLAWTEEIYPQLSGYDHIIESSPAFQRTISLLNKGGRGPSGENLIVPKEFTSRKQIVDLFAPQVAEGLEL